MLRLSACKYLGETALNALHGGNVLSELQELDMSYGSLGRAAIEGVLAMCPHLTQVSLNGCMHVTDHLWSRLATPPLPLESMASEDTGMEDASSLDDLVVDQRSPMEIPLSEVTSVHRTETTVSLPTDSGDWRGGAGQLAHQGRSSSDMSNSASEGLFPGSEIEHSAVKPGHHWPVFDHGHGSQGRHGCPFMSMPVESDVHAGPVRSLQTLNCVGCPNIQSVVIQRDAACLHLTTLNLSLSVHIREVRLGCNNLTTLNLRLVMISMPP